MIHISKIYKISSSSKLFENLLHILNINESNNLIYSFLNESNVYTFKN